MKSEDIIKFAKDIHLREIEPRIATTIEICNLASRGQKAIELLLTARTALVPHDVFQEELISQIDSFLKDLQ